MNRGTGSKIHAKKHFSEIGMLPNWGQKHHQKVHQKLPLTAALGNSLSQKSGRILIMEATEKYLISKNVATGHQLQQMDSTTDFLLIVWIIMFLIKMVSEAFNLI